MLSEDIKCLAKFSIEVSFLLKFPTALIHKQINYKQNISA